MMIGRQKHNSVVLQIDLGSGQMIGKRIPFVGRRRDEAVDQNYACG